MNNGNEQIQNENIEPAQEEQEVQITDIKVTVEDVTQEGTGSDSAIYPLTQVINALNAALTAENHQDPTAWLSSLENPANARTLSVDASIYLVNRALRLLIAERRDIPVEDRNGALLSIVDANDTGAWIKAMQAITIKVLVKYNIGSGGFVAADELAKEREASEITAPEAGDQ